MNRRGVILVGAVFAMLIFAVMALTGVSMLVNQSRTALHVLRSAQLGAARSGTAEYVMKRLQNISDWSNATGYTVTLGGFATEVTFSNRTPNRVTVTTVGRANLSGTTVSRRQQFDVQRLPQAFQFALWLNNPPTIQNTNIANGNIYILGQSNFQSNSLQDGIFYWGRLRAGDPPPSAPSGTILRAVSAPLPAMPQYNFGSSFGPLMTAYAQDAANAAGKSNVNLSTPGTYSVRALETAYENPNDGDGILEAGDLNVSVDITLAGPGKIVAQRDLYLQPTVPGACRFNDGLFRTTDGGCRRMADTTYPAGTVFSSMAGQMDWADAHNACNDLSEGGYGSGNWSLPSAAQLQNTAAVVSGFYNPFPFEPNLYFWTNETPGGSRGAHYQVNLDTGDLQPLSNSQNSGVVCVRSTDLVRTQNVILDTRNGSNLELVAGRNLVKTDEGGGLTVPVATGSPGNGTVNFYGNTISLAGSPRLVTRPADETNLTRIQLLSPGQILVGPRTTLNAAVLYSGQGVAGSGFVNVFGDGTDGGRPVITGMVISEGNTTDNPNVQLRNRVEVNGLVYSNSPSNAGCLRIDNATVTGSIVARQACHDIGVNAQLIRALTLAGGANNPPPLPNNNAIPAGFSSAVTTVPGTWQGD